jgi:hypothetical protein
MKCHMFLIFKNDARSLARRVTMWFFFQEFIATPVNGRPFLFRIDSERSTARHAIHLQFDISANAFEIRAVQSPKCIV